MLPLVYISSAYTKGDQGMNVRFQMDMFKQLVSMNAMPVAPLWSHYQHIAHPMPYEFWMGYDKAVILRCDALIRLNVSYPEHGYFQAESSGADREVAFAQAKGIPVFFNLKDLDTWLKNEWPKLEPHLESKLLQPAPSEARTQMVSDTT